MRNTKLMIYINDWEEVDLYDDFSINMNYNIADYRDINSKASNYSLTIEIPNTKHNALIFNNIHRIELTGGQFEILQKYPARLYEGGENTFTGFFILKDVVKGAETYYKANLYSEVKNFFETLGSETLSELDFSEYTTTMTAQTFIDKLNYNPADTTHELYDENSDNPPRLAKGFGLTVMDKNNFQPDRFTSSYAAIYNDELTPYLWVKEIWDKIFEDAGYTYTSRFLDYLPEDSNYGCKSFTFRNLIYPFCQHNTQLRWHDDGGLTVTQNENTNSVRFFGANLFPTNRTASATVSFSDITTNPGTYNYSDTQQSQYELLKWQPQYDGRYNFKASMPWRLGLIFAYYWFDPTTGWNQVKVTTPDVGTHNASNPLALNIQLCTTRNGNEVVLDTQTYTWDVTYGTIDRFRTEPWETLLSAGVYGDEAWSGTYNVDTQLYLLSTDVLYLKLSTTIPFYSSNENTFYLDTPEGGNNTRLSPAPRCYVEPMEVNSQAMSFAQNMQFTENCSFDPTAILSSKTKKKDFIGAIIKMFNLYLEDVSNKTVDGTTYPERCLRIEPYEIFYSDKDNSNSQFYNKIDFTQFIDTQSITFTRCEDYAFKNIHFELINDKDYWVNGYNERFEVPYGANYIDSQTNYETVTVQPALGATYCGMLSNKNNTVEGPRLFTLNNNGEVQSNKVYTDRILFLWANTRATLRIHSRISGSYLTVNQYNASDILDKGFGADDACLLWDSSDFNTNAYFWDSHNMEGTLFTWANAYNIFYKDFVAELTSQDNRILRCDAYISPTVISKLYLSNIVTINNIDYRINKITNYRSSKEPCEVELIKIIYLPTASAQAKGQYIDTQSFMANPININELMEKIEELEKKNAKLTEEVSTLKARTSV